MCGIAGIVTPDAPSYGARLQSMVAALRHRGPDGSGDTAFRGCALGHARLSIIDPESGQQPMTSADGRLSITFNGEIYGYREIRARLRDEPFRTRTDTEVILALYRRHGSRLLAQLPGMFAFALWDDARQALFCARDRFGEKPFYYARGPGGEFVFASEIKAILASGLVEPILSRRALSHYLRYLYVHPAETIYENVHALPPAHSLIVRRGQLTVERYWSPAPVREAIEPEEAVDEFRALFERAVSRQLVADAPLGAFLSGGLDSSTIVAVASRGVDRLRTLAFRFDGDLDERPFARAVAERYGTDHIEVDCGGIDPARHLVEMPSIYDEPLADSSCIPMALLCRAASRHVKVALTGDGGDELLGGYESAYIPLLHMQTARALPAWRLLLLRVARRVASRARGRTIAAWDRRAEGIVLRSRFPTVAAARRAIRSYYRDDELVRLGLDPGQRAPTGGSDDALRLDLEDYLPGDILVKGDRASMAHGLELRAPFLDVDLATFCLMLPDRLKLDGQRGKLLLREAYGDAWPPIVRARRKQGFGAPVRRWLREPAVRGLLRDYLERPGRKIHEVVEPTALRSLAEGHDTRTWALLVLSTWMEHHDFRIPEREVTTCSRTPRRPTRRSPAHVASGSAGSSPSRP